MKRTSLRIGLAVLIVLISTAAIAALVRFNPFVPAQQEQQTPPPQPNDVPPPTEPTPKPPTSISLNTAFTLRAGQTATITDGSLVTLVQINDSRCKPGVVCIWAGELAAEVTYVQNGKADQTLYLGLMTKTCDQGLTLLSITETNATFKKTESCE